MVTNRCYNQGKACILVRCPLPPRAQLSHRLRCSTWRTEPELNELKVRLLRLPPASPPATPPQLCAAPGHSSSSVPGTMSAPAHTGWAPLFEVLSPLPLLGGLLSTLWFSAQTPSPRSDLHEHPCLLSVLHLLSPRAPSSPHSVVQSQKRLGLNLFDGLLTGCPSFPVEHKSERAGRYHVCLVYCGISRAYYLAQCLVRGQ